MAMGSTGMAEHASHQAHLGGLPNTLPMMAGTGPFGPIEMGGMFTMFKIREHLELRTRSGLVRAPQGTVAWKVSG